MTLHVRQTHAGGADLNYHTQPQHQQEAPHFMRWTLVVVNLFASNEYHALMNVVQLPSLRPRRPSGSLCNVPASPAQQKVLKAEAPLKVTGYSV